MSLSGVEKKFILENKPIIEAILLKKMELKERIEKLSEDVKIRQYKDPARQEKHLINIQNEKIKRARMISRIIKKIGDKELEEELDLNPTRLREEIEDEIDSDLEYSDDDTPAQKVSLDKKSTKRLAKKIKGGARIEYR